MKAIKMGNGNNIYKILRFLDSCFKSIKISSKSKKAKKKFNIKKHIILAILFLGISLTILVAVYVLHKIKMKAAVKIKKLQDEKAKVEMKVIAGYKALSKNNEELIKTKKTLGNQLNELKKDELAAEETIQNLSINIKQKDNKLNKAEESLGQMKGSLFYMENTVNQLTGANKLLDLKLTNTEKTMADIKVNLKEAESKVVAKNKLVGKLKLEVENQNSDIEIKNIEIKELNKKVISLDKELEKALYPRAWKFQKDEGFFEGMLNDVKYYAPWVKLLIFQGSGGGVSLIKVPSSIPSKI
jgi:DNA repair exonuclease SbcCD ATPase subunit